MTGKEISALRKSGRLDEALEAAEQEYENNDNQYTATALFWCLNDKIKLQEGEEASATFSRMQEIYSEYGDGNDYMDRTMMSLSRKQLPYAQEISATIERAKANEDVSENYRIYSEAFRAGTLDDRLYPQFGWLTYYVLRRATDARTRKQLMATYFQLNLPKPSPLHSCILYEAVRLETEIPLEFRIRDFIRMWGMENLRDEDWEQYTSDNGNIVQSMVEKLIGVYNKEIKTDGIVAPDEYCQLVDKALAKYPNNQNLPRYKALALISQGKRDEALDYYRKLIMRFPSKFYLWGDVAELVEEIDTKVGLLSKALSCGDSDEFLGNIRLKLANLLAQKNLLSNAKYELEKYRETYLQKGWNLKSEFLHILNQYSGVEAAHSNASIYAEYASLADAFIFSALPTTLAVKVSDAQVDDKKHPGRKLTVWTLSIGKSILRLRKPGKHGLSNRMPNGTAFDVKILDDKVVWIKEHSGPISATWLKEVSGIVNIRLDRNGKQYAIIGGAYVGANLLNKVSDGQTIRIRAMKQKDDRWSAISVIN